jgi:hypothetical protein
MAFKMKGSPMNRNFGIGDPDKKAERKEKRAQRKRDRLAKKGKLIASEYMTPTDEEGVYDVEKGGVHSSVTDPKGVVVNPVGGSSTQYKVSKKGKIKKEV